MNLGVFPLKELRSHLKNLTGENVGGDDRKARSLDGLERSRTGTLRSAPGQRLKSGAGRKEIIFTEYPHFLRLTGIRDFSSPGSLLRLPSKQELRQPGPKSTRAVLLTDRKKQYLRDYNADSFLL